MEQAYNFKHKSINKTYRLPEHSIIGLPANGFPQKQVTVFHPSSSSTASSTSPSTAALSTLPLKSIQELWYIY